jgi:hypothetical protein
VNLVLFVAGLGAAVLLMLGIGRTYWKRRIGRWADEHGLTLLEFKGARFYEGPRASWRSDSQFAFRVVVEDASGHVRTGWLAFGSYFSFWPTSSPDVHWDD